MKPLIVTVTGPSSSGKTVLSHDLRDKGMEPLVSTTTRPMRKGERDGVDYHFTDVESFHRLEAENALIESIQYGSNFYGISRYEAERAFKMGRPGALVVEPHGVEQITKYCKQQGWDVFRIFVFNPPQVLMERMLHRLIEDVRDLCPGNAASTDGDMATIKAHIEPLLQADYDEKTMYALAQDFVREALGFDPGTLEQAEAISVRIRTHSDRITKVLGFEQTNWVKPALNQKAHYDLIVDRFDETNRDQVSEQVLQTLEQMGFQIGATAPEDSPRARNKKRP